MRTKTIVLLAAVGVASVATAKAQVYSVNAVGYVNKTAKAGLAMLANPLDNKNAPGNTIENLLVGLPDGSFCYTYDTPTKKWTINNFDFGEWQDKTQTLVPGQGFWLELPPGSAAVTITFVGEVKQGALETKLFEGFNLLGSQVPQKGKLQTELGYPPTDGDFIYTILDGKYTIYNYDFGSWAMPPEGPGEPIIDVAEGFWAERAPGAGDTKWTRNFSVNQ